MQAKSWHDNSSNFICPVESGECGKERKKIQKSKYLENKKSFSDETKSIFRSFWRVSFGEKMKSSGHKL